MVTRIRFVVPAAVTPAAAASLLVFTACTAPPVTSSPPPAPEPKPSSTAPFGANAEQFGTQTFALTYERSTSYIGRVHLTGSQRVLVASCAGPGQLTAELDTTSHVIDCGGAAEGTRITSGATAQVPGTSADLKVTAHDGVVWSIAVYEPQEGS